MSHSANAMSVYNTSFDYMTLGDTTNPGTSGQDGWYNEMASSPAYGEIQDAYANTGRALHQYVDETNPGGQQKIDRRNLMPPDLSAKPIVTLSVDFYCRTSDTSKTNTYYAGLAVKGGHHPGFEILGFSLGSGNGVVKSEEGVNVGIAHFNGVDNNALIPLTVGRGLSWDGWHSLKLVINQADDTYVSVTVDDQTQDLTGYALPRSNDSGQWLRGELMEVILAQIVPGNLQGDNSTSDDVYWDNLTLMIGEKSHPTTCEGDFDYDDDVDGTDLAELAHNTEKMNLSDFAVNFGKTGCSE